VASLLYAEPLVTFAAAVLLLGERISTITVAGGALVLASVVLTQYAPGTEPVTRLRGHAVTRPMKEET